MFVRSYSTLAKKTKLCILNWTWWSQFFDFHEKRKQVHGKFSVHDFFCITIYRCTKCTCKSKFQNDVRHFPQCMSHNEMIVLLSSVGVSPDSWVQQWVRVHKARVRVRVQVHQARVRVHQGWVRVHWTRVRVRVRVHWTRVRVRVRVQWVRVRVRVLESGLSLDSWIQQ